VQEVKREADWFRIGFEPIFVDLSKLGCFYLIFLLVKVCAMKWFKGQGYEMVQGTGV